MKSDKMNRLLSHTLIFKISPINAFITWEVLNLGYNIKKKKKIGGEKETKSIKIWLAAFTLLLLGGIVAETRALKGTN